MCLDPNLGSGRPLAAEYARLRTCRVPPAGKGLVGGTSVFTGPSTEGRVRGAAQNMPTWTGDAGSPQPSGCNGLLLNSIRGSSFLGLVLLLVRCFAGNLEPMLPWPNVTGKSHSTKEKIFVRN